MDNVKTCTDIGIRKVEWQSVLTANISLSNLENIKFKLDSEQWDNCGNISPHLEIIDANKNKEKVLTFLESNIGKTGLVSINSISEELKLTEEFILKILKEYGMDVI